MGIDANSLERYGGFDGMVKNLHGCVEKVSGAANEDFAYALYGALEEGDDLLWMDDTRGPDDTVADEIRAGIEALAPHEKTALVLKLRSLLRSPLGVSLK